MNRWRCSSIDEANPSRRLTGDGDGEDNGGGGFHLHVTDSLFLQAGYAIRPHSRAGPGRSSWGNEFD